MNNEEEVDNTSEIEDEVQPDWMEAIRPNANFSETLEENSAVVIFQRPIC
jgi:hypothetical protein